MSNAQRAIQQIMFQAGISINGGNPWDIQVHDERFYRAVLGGGSLALGESYMNGWWDVQQLDEFSARILAANLERFIRVTPRLMLQVARAKLFNEQSPSRAAIIGQRHYDLGNDLYRAMLDRRMVYTCGYWKKVDSLDAAQEAKLDLTCRKLGLQPGMRLLDIGCDWGSLAKFAAERYGVSVVGITVSKEQVELARQLCAGLPIEILLCDYREVTGQFDRVVSLGMIEHVGYKNYSTMMRVVSEHLVPDGLFLLHTIGDEHEGPADPWILKYIFPNSIVPPFGRLSKAMLQYFVIEDWHNFGPDYDPTLMAWFNNFDRHWPELRAKYGDRFYRMWKYYLLMCAGSFRSRHSQLWQIVMSKPERRGRYDSVR